MSTVIIEGKIEGRTEAARLITVNCHSEWVPLSQMKTLSQAQRDEHVRPHHVDAMSWLKEDGPKEVVLCLPGWLAIKKGWV